MHIQKFLDMISPSVIRFETDHFICENTYRWALREYSTSTDEQAGYILISYLMGESGKLLAEMAETGNRLESERFSLRASEDSVQEWVKGLELFFCQSAAAHPGPGYCI